MSWFPSCRNFELLHQPLNLEGLVDIFSNNILSMVSSSSGAAKQIIVALGWKQISITTIFPSISMKLHTSQSESSKVAIYTSVAAITNIVSCRHRNFIPMSVRRIATSRSSRSPPFLGKVSALSWNVKERTTTESVDVAVRKLYPFISLVQQPFSSLQNVESFVHASKKLSKIKYNSQQSMFE